MFTLGMLHERLSTQVILFTKDFKNQTWKDLEIKEVFPLEEL